MGRQQRSLAMEMEAKDDSAAGPSQLGYYYTEQLLLGRPTANVTRATRASPAPAYDSRALVRGKDVHAYS